MNVPYNTGKVKIGQYYQRPLPTYDIDKDMALLQTALVGDVKKIKKERLWNVVYVCVLFSTFGYFIFK